jgi:hypothetical protein
MAFQSRPSAISLMVKSNSLPATKSIAAELARLACGSTATLAPTKPALRRGFAALSASTTRTSEAKDGVEVCSAARS